MSNAGEDAASSEAADTGQVPGEDTAAFQRFYLNPQGAKSGKGLLYRIFVGWWRDKG